MSEFWKQIAASGPSTTAREAVFRLLGAMVLGWIVAWVYGRVRPPDKTSDSFRTTLVLLAMLIAIVTQVVGVNTARAFSLVGALSIVRFRTVVQDTQDTAFVIFAVVMGMSAGANDIWMSVAGIVLVSATAFAMNRKAIAPLALAPAGYTLNLRFGLGHDVDALVREAFADQVVKHRLVSIETARQGTAIEASYRIEFRPNGSPESLLKALNRTEGVQNVQLHEASLDAD